MTGLFRYPKRKLRKLINKGEYSEAIAFGREIESEYADDHDFMFIMGSAYFIVDDPEKALPYFEKAFRLDPDDIENLTLKTNAHLALQQKDEAIGCCERILELDPRNDEAASLLEKLRSL